MGDVYKDWPYYAKEDGTIWMHPVKKKDRITLGFHVCTVSESLGPDAASTIAELMNRGEEVTAKKEAS